MYICYIDESGCTGELPDINSAIQPVFVLAGIFIKQTHVFNITNELIGLKERFFPNLLPQSGLRNDWLAVEIKGSGVRSQARSTSRNTRRFAYAFLQEIIKIYQKYNIQIVSRVFIKNIGQPFVGTSVYSSCIQQICRDFNSFLVLKNAKGIVIADSRNKPKNANVSHSVFTQINSPASHQEYSKILEVPVFGHSDNHAGLQLADTLCSALLFPIATNRCCLNHMRNTTHCHEQHSTLISRYGSELKKMQYRYSKIEGDRTHWYGGISLSDPINRYNASVFFK